VYHDCDFIPIVLGSYDYVYPTLISFLNTAITKAVSFNDIPRSVMENHWMRSLESARPDSASYFKITAYTKKSLQMTWMNLFYP
jgi:hypothetical protein